MAVDFYWNGDKRMERSKAEVTGSSANVINVKTEKKQRIQNKTSYDLLIALISPNDKPISIFVLSASTRPHRHIFLCPLKQCAPYKRCSGKLLEEVSNWLSTARTRTRTHTHGDSSIELFNNKPFDRFYVKFIENLIPPIEGKIVNSIITFPVFLGLSWFTSWRPFYYHHVKRLPTKHNGWTGTVSVSFLFQNLPFRVRF